MYTLTDSWPTTVTSAEKPAAWRSTITVRKDGISLRSAPKTGFAILGKSLIKKWCCRMRVSLYTIIGWKFPNTIPGYRYRTADAGEFVVMPNHAHGILGIESVESVAVSLDDAINTAEDSDDITTAPNEFLAQLSSKSGSLSRVIGGYKSACSRMIQSVNTEPFAWQPRFHDLIIRD